MAASLPASVISYPTLQKLADGTLRYAPTDLIRFLASPYASWLDRFHLENPGILTPDEPGEDQQLIMRTGLAHEAKVLKNYRNEQADLAEIPNKDFKEAQAKTLEAIVARRAVIFQAALELTPFAGYADFLELHPTDGYRAWDAKLARSPKPYYLIQLCCYSEMLEAVTGRMPERFGIILGMDERVEFRVEDFIHYYRHVKAEFLKLQERFTGRLEDAPEPDARADHGRWTSHAERYFEETDHLVRVAGISVGQIKKLKAAGIATMADLARVGADTGDVADAKAGTEEHEEAEVKAGAGVDTNSQPAASPQIRVPKLAAETLAKLAAQARLQKATQQDRTQTPTAPPRYELLPANNATGLAALPAPHPADVFFDIEGYPLHPGGLEYLLGAGTRDDDKTTFHDWWSHDRPQEKAAFESFIDWVHARWRANPGMHVYHYAPYEVSAIRRLSTLHDSRQDEVDDMLRAGVFVDLYRIVRQGLRVGEDSYSIKAIERLHRPARGGDVASAVDSIVQYANWIASGEPPDHTASPILRGIRDYNEEDVRSTEELRDWLLELANKHGIEPAAAPEAPAEEREPNPDVQRRAELATALRDLGETVLADVLDFHRREDKPKWWRVFDRQDAAEDDLRDDPGCIAGIRAVGEPVPEKRSLVQRYVFDPNQECKLTAGERSTVRLPENVLKVANLVELDTGKGTLALKISKQSLDSNFDGVFPQATSVFEDEKINVSTLQEALTQLAETRMAGDDLPASVRAILNREPPTVPLRQDGESELAAALRVTGAMDGGCLVIQGPPGTGKTYTGSHAIAALLAAGKRVGIASNSHKAIGNLLRACGEAVREAGGRLEGVRVGGTRDDALHDAHPSLLYVSDSGKAPASYAGGVAAGTAWLFARPEWEGQLDLLFIDEAGQVALANALAMVRCARSIVLLGDQMQLEQPVQGAHPGDAGLSVLQHMLKDEAESRPDAPVFHAVVPPGAGLFLGTSRRMHPDVCRFVSESIYEGRLEAHEDCARQGIDVAGGLVARGTGVVFSPVEHDGNTQRSDEEVERVVAIYRELLGRPYTDKHGHVAPLGLGDFLFIAPYNAQVRALEQALPAGAKVGSVDRFQGQEAPVCIFSLCSSPGEYGSRGLGFILDPNRLNVAISRAMCLVVVVGDPRIVSGGVGSVGEMRLVNFYCKVKAT